ncbi:MAG: rhodanese-like domain-containing protein [Thermomicrobiales bacterium]
MESTKLLPPVIDAATADGIITERPDIRLIDVRTPAEFESVHIPGSYNVPLDTLSEHRRDIGDALSGPAILVCRSGARARQAELVLRNSGMTHLHVLDGGIMAWESQGKPVTRGTQKWGLERQVRGLAGGLVFAGAVGGLVLHPLVGLLAIGVGSGLMYSAVTDSCMMATLLSKLPYNRDASCDITEIIGRLQSENVVPLETR